MGSQAVPRSMTTYKGNAGNLMQHWTLCELLDIAGKHTSGLNFIDAHAMAPLARERTSTDPKFSRVQEGLSRKKSPYEEAWQRLTPRGGYPNSAAFVKKVWNGDFSLLLCETNPSTIQKIKPWLKRVERSELFQGDWRKRFDEGLPSPSEVGLADDSLTLFSFDPYMYNSRRRFDDPKKRCPGNLYPDDIERALLAMSNLEGGVLIQLSTYSTNDGNSQGAVISSVNSIMVARAFTLCAVVRVNRKMMSLVYARNVSWSAELADLPDGFEKWLSRKC